jgi:hypothetical protein
LITSSMRPHHFGEILREQFGDDGEAGFLARLGQHFQAAFAQALEFVGRRARFEGSAAQDGGAGLLDGAGGGH